MARVVWRPGCPFRLLCNKMVTLRFIKYAVQPFNFISFLFPVYRLQVLVPLIVKGKDLFWKPRTGEEGKGSLFGSLFKIQVVMVSDALQAIHHGPCCCHKASYLSQVSLLMERKAQEQSSTGCRPLHSWADVELCGAVLQELSCSLLSSSLLFPSSSTRVRFLSRTGQEQ